jgi:hypothetical protein
MWLARFAASLRGRIDELALWAHERVRLRGRRIRYENLEELPDTLNPATLYVAGEGPHAWGAAMLCPCGCGDVVQLNLLKQARPCWAIRHHRDGTVSVIPSIWRTKGCRSHFSIRQGRIHWYGN